MKHLLLIIMLMFFTSCDKVEEGRFKIAILTPITHPSLEQTETAFIETLTPGKYRTVTYNAQGSKTLMRAELEEIIIQKYDLIYTIGTNATQMATEVLSKKQIATPIVFSSVSDPVGFHIGGTNVTGVQEIVKFEEELAALLEYKPLIKRLLVVYNPLEPGLQKDCEEFGRILQQRGIALETVEIFQVSEILAKTSAAIERNDAVLVLKDNTVVSGLEALVKSSERYHIPLMASDLDSPDKGAAFGYGVYEREFGIEAAKKATLILEHDTPPSDIPVTPVSGFHLRVNKEAAKKQGVTIP